MSDDSNSKGQSVIHLFKTATPIPGKEKRLTVVVPKETIPASVELPVVNSARQLYRSESGHEAHEHYVGSPGVLQTLDPPRSNREVSPPLTEKRSPTSRPNSSGSLNMQPMKQASPPMLLPGPEVQPPAILQFTGILFSLALIVRQS